MKTLHIVSSMRKMTAANCLRHFVFLVAGFAGLSCLQVHAQSAKDNALILPGKSIGEVKLDIELPAVEKKLGKPTTSEGATGRVWAIWDSPKDGAGQSYRVTVYGAHTASNDSVQSVVSIRVNSPFFHTREGINTQSRLEAIWKVFPDLRYDSAYHHNGKEIEVYADRAHGISFEIRRATVDAGAPLPAGAAWGTCQAISVYEVGSGEPLVPTQ